MKSKIQIVGFSRKFGTSSKTGKAYDFCEVSFLVAEDPSTTGLKAYLGICDWRECSHIFTDDNTDKLFDCIGINCNCVFHLQNGRCIIDAFI